MAGGNKREAQGMRSPSVRTAANYNEGQGKSGRLGIEEEDQLNWWIVVRERQRDSEAEEQREHSFGQ